jgi:hypothetical protein
MKFHIRFDEVTFREFHAIGKNTGDDKGVIAFFVVDVVGEPKPQTDNSDGSSSRQFTT